MKRAPIQAKPTKPLQWEDLRVEVTDELLAGMTQRIVDRFHPYKVILFGSYAYGKPHVYSDVDLLVVMDSEERWPQRVRRVREVAKVPFVPMDVLVLTPKELAERIEMGDFFYKEITEKGRYLYRRGDSR